MILAFLAGMVFGAITLVLVAIVVVDNDGKEDLD